MQGADAPEWPPRLGDEPPAIANLLVRGFEVTRSAVAATLLDLVARGMLALDQTEPGVYLVRIDSGPEPGLRAYERQVYDAVVDAASHRTVPVEDLTKELRLQPRSWMREFRGAVVAHAQECGLVRVRWSDAALFRLPALIAVAVGLLGLSALVLSENGLEGLKWGVVVAWAVATLGIFAPDWLVGRDLQRPTSAGARAADRWNDVREALAADESLVDVPPTAVAVWDRIMAYAVALGVAHRAAAELPLGDDDGRRVWSSATGRWRRVAIRYPRVFPPAWGRPPGHALAMALPIGLLGGWLVSVLVRPGRPHPSPPFGPGAAEVIGRAEPVLWVGAVWMSAWSAVVLALLALERNRKTVRRGVVVRVRSRRGHLLWPEMPRTPTRWYVAVDDGSSDRIRAYRLRGQPPAELREHDEVQVDASRWRGFVTSIEPVDQTA